MSDPGRLMEHARLRVKRNRMVLDPPRATPHATHLVGAASKRLQQSFKIVVRFERQHDLAPVFTFQTDFNAGSQEMAKLVLDCQDVARFLD